MKFADLHIHALFGSDDGAGTLQEMLRMVDAAYASGTRMLCMTPHFHPGYFGDNQKQSNEAYRALRHYVQDAYPDLRLYIGNELRYSPECVSWLSSGWGRTLHGSRYVLVDFTGDEEAGVIIKGLDQLMNAGYHPILAHGERYRNLSMEQLRKIRQRGCWIQVDAQAILGAFGLRQQLRSRALLKERLADFVASDGHDLTYRPPQLGTCCEYVTKKFGAAYAKELFWNNTAGLLESEGI